MSQSRIIRDVIGVLDNGQVPYITSIFIVMIFNLAILIFKTSVTNFLCMHHFHFLLTNKCFRVYRKYSFKKIQICMILIDAIKLV